MVPYDATGANYAARLSIDLGDGDTYLTKLANYAVTNWLKTSAPVLDYANAMVGSQKTSVASFRIACAHNTIAVSVEYNVE